MYNMGYTTIVYYSIHIGIKKVLTKKVILVETNILT